MRMQPLILVIVLLMIGWPLTTVGSAVAAPTENPALAGNTVEANFIEENDNQFTNVSDDLIVWERGLLPLRADTTADSAQTVIVNHDLTFKDNRSGVSEETSANRPETAIFEKGETVPVEFRSVSGANTDNFGDRDAQVIVASFDENTDTGDVASLEQLNDVVSPALSGNLSELRTEATARNVTFSVENTTLEDGELTYDLQPDTAGPYVVMVALPRSQGAGFATDSDDLLTLSGDATLMGIEALMVQDSASGIDIPDQAEPGDDIDVAASTELTGEMTHSVVVYNEDVFLGEDEKTTLRLDEDSMQSLTSDDIVVEHSIANVNGVGEMTDSGTIFGTSVSQRTVTGTVPLADITDRLSDESDVSINRETIEPRTELDASGVVEPNANAETDLTVQTFGNWSEGTYRIVHVAENGTVEGVATTTETITISDQPPVDDGDGVGDGAGTGTGGATPPTDAQTEVTITERLGGASVSVTNIQANTPTRIGLGQNVTSNGVTVQNFTVDLVENRPELNLEVDTSDQPPENVPAASTGESLSYINVDAGDLTDDDYNSIEWEFTIDQDRLDERDRSPESVRLNRYNETSGEWESFETTHEGGDEFTATAPGFSAFAVTTVAPDEETPSTDDDGVEETDGVDDDSTDGDGMDDDVPDDDDSPVGIVVILIVIAIAVAVGVGLYQSQRE